MKPRTLPLRGELRVIIERRLKARRLEDADGKVRLAEYIFHRGGVRMGEFRKLWTTACRKAGLAVAIERDGKTVYQALWRPYDLRRTAVPNMVRGGNDPAVAMKISGHKTRSVFDRYNIIDDRDLVAAVEKTDATVSNIVPLRTASTQGWERAQNEHKRTKGLGSAAP